MPPQTSEHSNWFSENLLPHEPMLRAWLRGRFADEGDLDDIVQESYLRVLRAKESTEIRSPKTFLFTIARNVAVSHGRRLRSFSSEPLTESACSNVPIDNNDIPDIVARHQEFEILAKAIASLPKKCRKIFIMRKIHGKSQKEIASELGLSTNTVSAQLNIGLGKCAAYFDQYNEGIHPAA